jgi:hypothetical protein
MAGLVPTIHAFSLMAVGKAWMPGTRPGMTGNRACLYKTLHTGEAAETGAPHVAFSELH